MTISSAQKRAVAKYNAANYDRIEVKVPKGRKQVIETHAKQRGKSVNGLVNALLRADMGFSEGQWKNTEE